MAMHPRLTLDISWSELISAALAPGGPAPGEADWRRVFSDGELVEALSVRTLFDAILTVLDRNDSAPILMTGVTIANMAEIASAHGRTIIAVDLDPHTLLPPPGALLDAQAQSGAKICVIAHLYGAVSVCPDVEALRARGVTVIEDEAQAFAGAGFNSGDPSASASLFSFGPIKRATALGGALGVFRDAKLAEDVAAVLAEHPRKSDVWFRQRAVKYLALKALNTPALYGALIGLIQARGKDPDTVIGAAARGFSGDDLLTAIRHAPPDRLLALAARQANACPDPSERRAAVARFLDQLPQGVRPPGTGADRHAWWLLALLHGEPASAVAALRQAGFDATRGATSLRAIDPDATPNAARLIKHAVYLPHPAHMSQAAAERMAQAVTEIEGWLSP
ncbi:MAG: DegT/DnrJ/EryC1/StrS family aminotransferase [Alphaproteobacteria bacterium]|nr:DegT/DnrJ/EryC1/StrS family aminotransferase [Alphaproteobacteria bacterium]